MDSDTLLHIVIGAGVPLALFAFGVWIRAETRNRDSFQRLFDENDHQHQLIRRDMTDQHHAIRDKIEKIWQHMKNGSS